MPRLRALLFDVFGTLVDWRSGVAREAEAVLAPLGITLDWLQFADAWRAQYQPTMDHVRVGRMAFCKLDMLHRRNLDRVLSDFGQQGLGQDARVQLNLSWHRLDAWPDVAAGLARLQPKFMLAPCSNGNISLMVDLARRNGFPWDAILGAEIARDYKPNPVVYLSAAAALDCEPAEVMMVAAHASDLAAAAAVAMRTAFIARPDEYGPGHGKDAASVAADIRATGVPDLADQLAANAGFAVR